MEIIISSKTKRSGKIAGVVVLWSLAGGVLWAGPYFGFPILPAAIFAAVLILVSLVLLRSAFQPKRDQWLTIDADAVRWRVRRGTEPVVNQRIPLNSIQSCKIVTTPNSGDAVPPIDLYFVLRDGSEKQVPREFSPALHRERIEDALREQLPNLKIQELSAAENA